MKRDMAKEKSCKNMIEKLNVSDEIKDILFENESVASSDNILMKASVKDLFIKSPSCKALSHIGKCFDKIIVSNNVYPVRGSKTYLELAFPASFNPKDYEEFYASPRIVAEILNNFSGVFLISFEKWKSARELIGSDAWPTLTHFIVENKSMISFIFHVTPEFKDVMELFDELSKYTNMFYLEHATPDIKQSVAFVKKKLTQSGIELSDCAESEMEKLFEEKFAGEAASCRDYRNLEKLAANLSFELYVHSGKKAVGCDSCIVDGEDIRKVSDKLVIRTKISERRVGFR